LGRQLNRRDRTTIKIFILRELYLKGQVALYSGRLGGLAHEVCTNPQTFYGAIEDLKRSGLIVLDRVDLGGRKVRVARITEKGRQQVAPSLQLLSQL